MIMFGLFAKHAQKFCGLPKDIADASACLVFKAIEAIIWKLPIVTVVLIASKFFEATGTIGTIGTIRTMIWKPDIRVRLG